MNRFGAATLALLVAVAGCSGGGSHSTTPAGAATTTPTTTTGPSADPGPRFTSRVLASGLANPWEIIYGPDGYLWVTEKSAGRVTRVSVRDGTTRTALTVPDLLATQGAQDGLLGMALGLPYVYLAYTYADPDRRAKIVRYTYDAAAQALGSPVPLLTRLPASVDHDSGRLVLGPDRRLYYTIGDQGNNQFTRYCEPIQAQTLPTAAQVAARDWSAYQGKVLRLNLDGSVPADNPVLRGVRSHVYSYGHRNAQGLVFGPGGRLYSSEQGPKTDDELNLIRAGGNYGWPRVAGFKDDSAYVYGDWAAAADCPTLGYSDYEIPPPVPQERESSFTDPAFTPPLRTFYTVGSDHNFRDPKCSGNYFMCWPTVAPSSLDIYPAGGAVPGWANSLLMTSLKDGAVYRIPLGPAGTPAGEAVATLRSVNRYRDTAVSPDGRYVFVATDSGGTTRDRSGRPTEALEYPGSILEFTYAG